MPATEPAALLNRLRAHRAALEAVMLDLESIDDNAAQIANDITGHGVDSARAHYGVGVIADQVATIALNLRHAMENLDRSVNRARHLTDQTNR